MIAIYTRAESEWAECLRETLRAEYIPCALIGPEYGYASLAARVPYVILGRDLPIQVDSFLRQIPAHKILTWSEDASVLSVIREAYKRDFHRDMESIHSGGVWFLRNQIRFRGARLHLTPNEKRILNLLIWCEGRYFLAEEIAVLCLRNASCGAVAVHICNMNTKALEATNHKMIECRRFGGYRIP